MRVKRTSNESRVVYGDSISGKEKVQSIVLNSFNMRNVVNSLQKETSDNSNVYKYENHSIKFDYVRYGGRMGSNARRVFHTKANIAGMILGSNGYVDRLIDDFENAFAPDEKNEQYSIPIVVVVESDQNTNDETSKNVNDQLNEKLGKYSNWQILYTEDANDSKVTKDALDYILSFH